MLTGTTVTLFVVFAVVLTIVCRPRLPRQSWIPFAAPCERLAALGFDRSLVQCALGVSVGGLHALAVLIAVTRHQYGVGVALVAVAWVAPSYVLRFVMQRRERRLRNQIADAALVMASAVRAGMAPATALAQAAADSAAPLAPQLKRLVRDYERGAPLRAALLAANQRLALDAFTLLTTAVNVTLECGGRLDEALCRISDSIHSQQRLEDKLQAATSSGRHALLLMAAFPVGFTAFLYQLDSSGLDKISASVAGQIGIGSMILVICLAIRWGMAILERVQV